MSVTISRSSTKLGSGVISAITMASTASGTAISPRVSSGSAWIHSGVPGPAIAFDRSHTAQPGSLPFMSLKM